MGLGLFGGNVTEEWALKRFSPHWQQWKNCLVGAQGEAEEVEESKT